MHDVIVVGVGPERPAKSIGGYTGAMALQGWPLPDESLDAIRQDEQGLFATRCVGWRVAEMAKILKLGLGAIDERELKWPKAGSTGSPTGRTPDPVVRHFSAVGGREAPRSG
ncbi:MAG TPA: hypothetical protein VJ787_09660 [Thermoleophilia bacterium]|nr:hypothetical protein [Thermoleophilia bacterium]